MNRDAEETFDALQAEYAAELAQESSEWDFEPVAESELRRRFYRERRAQRTWLRAATRFDSSVRRRRPRTQRRRRFHPCGRRARAARHRRSLRRPAGVQSTRGDPNDGDPGPSARGGSCNEVTSARGICSPAFQCRQGAGARWDERARTKLVASREFRGGVRDKKLGSSERRLKGPPA
jgi:hypothetical protein